MKEGFSLEDLERTATIITWDGRRFVYEDEDFRDCHLELDAQPSAELRDRLLASMGTQAKEASRVETPFEKVAPQPQTWWHGDTKDGLKAPLGRAGARKVQCLELGQGMAQHVLVVGKTGAGKSTLLHTLVTALALSYPPSELEMYLVDFKKGVEFKTYAIHELPHARVIAIESEREFGLSVLQGLNSELNRRGELFRSVGADHISDYRHKSGKVLPRIILIVDEFQEFFVEDDVIASQSSQILDRLVRQGRAFGIHVLLGSQTLAGTYTLSRSTVDQMAVRIALQCSEADSRLILAEDNPLARHLSRPGEAIYNAANGLVEGNNLFQVAWLPDEKRNAYLKHIQSMARDNKYVQVLSQVVFEGNAPAEVSKNSSLHSLLVTTTRSPKPRRVAIWLGEPVAMKEPTTAHFKQQSGSNLLVVGQNDETAAGMMLISLVSLAAQLDPQDVRFYVLNFSQADAPYINAFTDTMSLLPNSTKFSGRRTLSDSIVAISDEVKQRINEESNVSKKKESIYLAVFGLQRARDLRQEDETPYRTSDEEPITPNIAERFNSILRDGPEVDIHTLVWCDTYANLARTLDRRTLGEFEMRIVFQMSAEDSSNLVDSAAASKLGSHRVLFYGEEEGRLEKLRPYGFPTKEWLAWVAEQLKKRKNEIPPKGS